MVASWERWTKAWEQLQALPVQHQDAAFQRVQDALDFFEEYEMPYITEEEDAADIRDIPVDEGDG